MVTLSTSSQLSHSRAQSSLGYDFALLGLKGREARVDVIRGAASRIAARIPDTLDDTARVEMLSELAASTYRLLDPRRRMRSLERVQLSMCTDNDPVLATVGRKPLVATPLSAVASTDPLVIAEVVLPADSCVQLASKVARDSVSCINEEKPPRKPKRLPRVGIVAVQVLAAVVAANSLIAWLIFG